MLRDLPRFRCSPLYRFPYWGFSLHNPQFDYGTENVPILLDRPSVATTTHTNTKKEIFMTNTADWISFIDKKLIACAAGVERLVPATEGELARKGVNEEGATHELHLSAADIVQPQEMATFIDDGHGKGVRLVLTTDHLYRWVSTHRLGEKMVFLVSLVDDHLAAVQDALANASEFRVLINGEAVKVER